MRHIHTQRNWSDELPTLCLLMNGFFRHTGVLRIAKAEENKGALGQAQTGAIPGDECLSQLERRHTSGEYGKIYQERERMRFKRWTPLFRERD